MYEEDKAIAFIAFGWSHDLERLQQPNIFPRAVSADPSTEYDLSSDVAPFPFRRE